MQDVGQAARVGCKDSDSVPLTDADALDLLALAAEFF